MPTYQYACTECAERLEAVQSFADPALTVCPACQGRLRKVFNSVGIVFKGSGFYRNDSRAGEVTAEKANAADSSTSGSDSAKSGSDSAKSGSDSSKSGSDSSKSGADSSKSRSDAKSAPAKSSDSSSAGAAKAPATTS